MSKLHEYFLNYINSVYTEPLSDVQKRELELAFIAGITIGVDEGNSSTADSIKLLASCIERLRELGIHV